MDDLKKQPIEVDLVERVKTCTDCNWFWQAVPPYGPHPSFDWDETYPAAIKNGPDNSAALTAEKPLIWAGLAADAPKPWTTVREKEKAQIEPAVMRGCRKAPLMTVGINPNMTAFFAGVQATTWAYPHFSKEATYAYYYRHATLYQESFALDDLKQQIIPGSEILAPADGNYEISRSDTFRWLSIVKQPEQEGDPLEGSEHAWMPDERLVVFAPYTTRFLNVSNKTNAISNDKDDPVSDPSDNFDKTNLFSAAKYQVKKGDLLAAKIKADVGSEKTIYANTVGYYNRLAPVIKNLNTYFGEQGFTECDLTMGEDFCMHDMVGCASPGWSSRYDIPTDWISHKCVVKNQYVYDQLFQTNPRVVIIVSSSSLVMFESGFAQAGITMDALHSKDNFELLQETATQRRFIKWQKAGKEYQSRILVTPHFSYGDNFEQQSRVPEALWQSCKNDYADDVQTLKDHHIKINEQSYDGSDADPVAIFITSDASVLNDIHPEFKNILLKYHMDPFALIEQALKGEHEIEPLITDKTSKHLDRSTGPCQFCINDKWQFPEGCEYGVAKT